MIAILLLIVIAVIAGVCFLIFKAGGFLLSGMTGFVSRLLENDLSDSDIIFIPIVVAICGLCIHRLYRIYDNGRRF